MSHRQVMDAHRTELKCILRDYDEKVGTIADDEMLSLRRAENAELMEFIQNQNRVMDFWEGKEVQPEVHFGEGVLIGTFGETFGGP